MANYVITRQAEDDIAEIIAYIVADNWDAALKFNSRLIEIFEILSRTPKGGRERPELLPNARSIPEGNYLVFYQEFEKNIAILRVLHCARDLDEIFS